MGNSKSKNKTDSPKKDVPQNKVVKKEDAVLVEHARSFAISNVKADGPKTADIRVYRNTFSCENYRALQKDASKTENLSDVNLEEKKLHLSRPQGNGILKSPSLRENNIPDTRQKDISCLENASARKKSDSLNLCLTETRHKHAVLTHNNPSYNDLSSNTTCVYNPSGEQTTTASQKYTGLTGENPTYNSISSNTTYGRKTSAEKTTTISENTRKTRNSTIIDNDLTLSGKPFQPFQNSISQSGIISHESRHENEMRTPENESVKAFIVRGNYIADTRHKENSLLENTSARKNVDSLNEARHKNAVLTHSNPPTFNYLSSNTTCVHKPSGDQTTSTSHEYAGLPGGNETNKIFPSNTTHVHKTSTEKTTNIPENTRTLKNSTSFDNNLTLSGKKFQPFQNSTSQSGIISHESLQENEMRRTLGNESVKASFVRGNCIEDTIQKENSCVEKASVRKTDKDYVVPLKHEHVPDKHIPDKHILMNLPTEGKYVQSKVCKVPIDGNSLHVRKEHEQSIESKSDRNESDIGTFKNNTLFQSVCTRGESVIAIKEGIVGIKRSKSTSSYDSHGSSDSYTNHQDKRKHSEIGNLDIFVDELDMRLDRSSKDWEAISCYSNSGYSSSRSSSISEGLENSFGDGTSSKEDLNSNSSFDEMDDEMSDDSSLNEDDINIQEGDTWRAKLQEVCRKFELKKCEDVAVGKSQIYEFKISSFLEKDTVLDFIQSRMPKTVKFDLLECEHKKRNTFVTLKFPSKRMAFKTKVLLHQRNKQNRVKIWMISDKTQSSVSLENNSDDNNFQQLVDNIIKKAESTLYTHEQKTEKVRMKLNDIRNEMGRKKFLKLIKFELYQNLAAERKALHDQLTELQLQKEEFNINMKQLSERLESVPIGEKSVKEMQDIQKSFGVECVRLREALPIYARRSAIQKTIKENKVSIILGETGSGKSTQLPQYVYREPWIGNGLIVCTQPRKVAAETLATRVASEIATSVGQEVGYHVGMKTKKSESTKILYMTDHCLLNECLKDNTLSAYSCIIIDEAHERSIFTDLLLGMIKRCLTKRDDLRIIVTSATIDPGVFQAFFNNCPVLKVSGRMFPVQVIWKEPVPGQEPFHDYENNAVQKAIEIHLNEPAGDILVFLTSPLEAENCCNSFQKLSKDKTGVICLQLHSRVQSSEQQLVFRATPSGKRKIVFATNSAETSITIPNIRYVIDTGLMKENQYDPVRNLSTLSITMVTKSNADQRKGRAGRTVAGKCYRLYTEHDFESMKPNNIPELLRINLGQAILKLFELGVNPFKFEFVQSPNRKSMESTLSLLEDIGAVEQSLITELGKWISKLPVDPTFGAFIYQCLQYDIAPEAIVIAAFVSATGSVFYRGGSQSQKDAADRIKTKFCHPGGDFLSYLNVFREWFKQPEKGKSKWCFDNSINGKTLKSVRETVNEILLILRKEHKMNVRLEFSETPDKIQGLLIKLLLKTLKANISHYLGHQSAGYLYVEKNQYIHLHPSSCLLALGYNPEWIVFLKVMRSSRDYAMEVVPVSDEILIEAITEGWITVDLEEAKSRRITDIATFYVGSQVFWDFVGPRYTNLRELEQQFLEIIHGSPGVIETDKTRGHIKVYASEEFTDLANDMLTEELEYILEQLRNEESEQKLSQHTDKIRAAISQGASVRALYMPDQYKIVDIFCSSRLVHSINEDMILHLFEQFGYIRNHWFRKIEKVPKSSKMSFVGKVTFDELESAANAVNGTKYNDDIQARSSIRDNGNDPTGFKAVLSWCRRPSKGFGFVELTSSKHVNKAVYLRSISVGGSRADVKQSRKNDRELYITNLKKIVNEDVLRQGIADALGIDALNDIGRVTVIREKVETTKNEFNTYQRRLRGLIKNFVKNGNFEVDLRQPRPNDHNFVAYVRFSDPDDGERACREINYSVNFNGETIAMKADLSTSIYIHKNIYEKIADTLEHSLESEQEEGCIKTKTKQLRNGNFVIDLHADNPDELASMNRVINKLVRGEKLSCQQGQKSDILFTRNGREKLTTIMRKTNTFINIDNRVMEITIHGSSQNQDRALEEINKYLTRLKNLSAKQVELKGEDKPIGVMKALLIKYGITLDKLRIKAELSNLDLDHRNHRLRMTGTEKAIETGCSMINEVISSVIVNPALLQNVDDPECAICLTSVDDYEHLYRLECCGHPYHKECIELQMISTVKNKEIPVKCSFGDCESHFVWKDIQNIARLGLTSVSDLVTASVSSFVSKNSKAYQYCVTPDCPIVYKVDKKGKCFRCPDCQIRICTSCKIQFHDGMTCAMYKGEKGDKSVAHWIRQDPDRRKLCPKCSMPIEKTGGCNRMECLSCRKQICWVCLQFFDSDQECYKHLFKKHGSFA